MNKRIISIVLAVMMCLSISVPVMAASIPTANATYSSGVVTVTGSGLTEGYSYTARVVNATNTSLLAMQQVTADSSGVISASITTGTLAAAEYVVYVNKADGTLAVSDTFTVSIGGGGGTTTYYNVIAIQSNGGTITLSSASVKMGESVTVSITPDAGYKVNNVLVNNVSVGAITSYIIKDIAKDTTVEAMFEKTDNAFKDVAVSSWYYDAVMYVAGATLMNGTSNTNFSPNMPMTRAMFVTVLYRLADKPAVTTSYTKFTDVATGSWYEDAVIWGTANGVVRGIGYNLFDPNASVTREQMATFMHRYVSFSGLSISENGSNLSDFNDANSVSLWALDAMKWAVENGLIIGMNNVTIAPQGTATRAQVATILMRLVEDLKH